jgi:hypothetical protein
MAHADLVLHVGARRVKRNELDQVPCLIPKDGGAPSAMEPCSLTQRRPSSRLVTALTRWTLDSRGTTHDFSGL